MGWLYQLIFSFPFLYLSIIPLIAASVTTKKMTPITQRIVIIATPFRCSESGISGFLLSKMCANPNNSENQLMNAEIMTITMFTKIGSLIIGNFIRKRILTGYLFKLQKRKLWSVIHAGIP
jgi:hypothetical protein